MAQYDLAISFAGEDREVAGSLANLFYEKYNLSVFYDDYEQARLIGSNLTEYLIDIYKNKAMYCVVLVSKAYKEKRWTRHEWRAAQARAFEEPELDYILPVRIDNTELPGLLPTVGYLSLGNASISEVAELIYLKISSTIEKLRAIRLAENYYNNNQFVEALNVISDAVFDKEIDALRIRGDSFGKLNRYTEAIETLETLLTLIEKDFLSHFLLGIFYYRTSDFEKSVKHYEIANSIFPNHPTIQTDLPAARKMLGKFK